MSEEGHPRPLRNEEGSSPGQVTEALTPDELLEDYLDHALVPMVGVVPYSERQRVRVEWSDHLRSLAERAAGLGVDPDAALRAALDQFGNPDRVGSVWVREWLRTRVGAPVLLPAVVGLLLLVGGLGVCVSFNDIAANTHDVVPPFLWQAFSTVAPLLLGIGVSLLFPFAPWAAMVGACSAASLVAALSLQSRGYSMWTPETQGLLALEWLAISSASVAAGRVAYSMLLRMSLRSPAALDTLRPGSLALGAGRGSLPSRAALSAASGMLMGALILPPWVWLAWCVVGKMGGFTALEVVPQGAAAGAVLGLLLGPVLGRRWCLTLGMPAVSLIPSSAFLAAILSDHDALDVLTAHSDLLRAVALLGGAYLVTLSTAVVAGRLLTWLSEVESRASPWGMGAAR
ncbi:MAG TPA: hypothetical protein VGN26_09540 [Armatimonadota bacterium]|jgi:hypothetical protein